jgi:nitroreductase
MKFDIAMTDELLATTRAVRKRLDLDRPVPREIIMQCLELAVQAPTGSNSQTWRWVVVDDPDTRAKLAEIYNRAGSGYLASGAAAAAEGSQIRRVLDSALWLAENMAKAPVFVIPCVQGRVPDGAPNVLQASTYGSIFPAVWSFQLALRSRGLGSTLTTLHLMLEAEAAAVLGLPDDVMQVALLPVAYTKGTDFKRAERPPVSEITHWNTW